MFDKFDFLIRSRSNCELVKNNLQNQPVNLITNLAFFISGWAIYRLLKKYEIVNRELWWLFYGTVAVGAGSTIRHYHASAITLIIDGLPMLGFMLLAVYVLSRYLFSRNPKKSLLITFGYLILIGLLSVAFAKILRPAITFSLSSQFMLLPLILISHRRNRQITGILITAALFFLLAAASFIIDLSFCPNLTVGTHFLWHIFNATALYYLSKYFILSSL